MLYVTLCVENLMNTKEEDMKVGEKAAETFSNFLDGLPEDNAFKTNPLYAMTLGMIWLTAFDKGYEFHKEQSLLNALKN